MTQPGRSYNSPNYRYGFNGKENDREYGTAKLTQDYGFRMYNPALGRFLSVDPLSPDYPWYTPYQFAGNKPVKFVDLDGLEEYDLTLIFYKGRPALKIVMTNSSTENGVSVTYGGNSLAPYQRKLIRILAHENNIEGKDGFIFNRVRDKLNSQTKIKGNDLYAKFGKGGFSSNNDVGNADEEGFSQVKNNTLFFGLSGKDILTYAATRVGPYKIAGGWDDNAFRTKNKITSQGIDEVYKDITSNIVGDVSGANTVVLWAANEIQRIGLQQRFEADGYDVILSEESFMGSTIPASNSWGIQVSYLGENSEPTQEEIKQIENYEPGSYGD